MPLNFEISAPGKIILHGEHSVVYNKPAIAGPIGLRTYFNFQETSNDCLNFYYSRLNLAVKLSFANAKLLLGELDCHEAVLPIDFLHKFRNSKDFMLKYIEYGEQKLNDKEEMAVGATLYIMNRIMRSENIKSINKAFDVKIDSDMSIGAGVGSSASYGVCLASGFYILSQIINGKLDECQLKEFSFDNSDIIRERVSQWAFDSEVIMHEKPSGIDNTICTYGQLIKFSRGQTPEPIKTSGKVDILLVDTGVSRSTSHVVGRVANFRNKYPSLANSIFDAMGHLADDVVTILENDKSEAEKYQEFSLLVAVNNNLLRSIGVSHPRLEKVFNIAESYGYNAKLTGAGFGGCAFVLLPSSYEESKNYQRMCEDLKANDYHVMATIIGGRGVDFKYLEN